MENNGTSFFKKQPIFILDHESLDVMDVNEAAVEFYGYSRHEFLTMNINDLGVKKKRSDINHFPSDVDLSTDKIWVQKNRKGEKVYVQFTDHTFNYNGKPSRFAVAHDVSDQVEQGEERRVKFPKFITHESNYPLAEIEWNSNLKIKNWSDKAEDLFGWSEEEVLGRDDFFEKFIADEEVTAAKENIRKAIEDHEIHYTTESKVNTKSGSTLICKWYNSLIYNENNDLYSIHSLVSDISGQKQSENLFRALSEESLVGVYLIQDNKFKYVNPRFADIFGYSRDEIMNSMSPLDLTHPDDRDIVEENIRQRIEGEADSMEYDFRCLTKGGDVIDVSVFGAVITYLGEPAVVGTLLDITENKEMIRKYQASLESFEDLFDSISDAIYIQDKEGRFLEVNQGAVDMYGYDQSFFIGKTPEVLAAPGKVDMAETKKKVAKALNGIPQSFKWWGKRKNGEVFPKEVVANPGTYFGEDVIITIARDISDRFKAEEDLRRNEEMFRQLFQNAPVPIAFLDKRQEIKKVNNSFEDTFGYETGEIQGLDIDRILVPKEEQEVAREVSDRIFEGKPAFHTGRRICKNGNLIDVLIYGVPVIVNEKTVAIFGIYVDITERKQAEEKVKKSLKEKEVLLAEIHHRVKNNLAVITGLLELQAYNTMSENATEVLKASQMRVNSIALIHEKLYQNENLSEISFDIYLEELTDAILASMQSQSTEISVSIDADPIELTISQAIPCGLILNELITNAHKHAFPDQQEGEIYISLRHSSENNIKLIVQDNGKGMPDDITLDQSQTLGLQLIGTLSKQLKGDAKFVEKDVGTTFMLQFEYEE